MASVWEQVWCTHGNIWKTHRPDASQLLVPSSASFIPPLRARLAPRARALRNTHRAHRCIWAMRRQMLLVSILRRFSAASRSAAANREAGSPGKFDRLNRTFGAWISFPVSSLLLFFVNGAVWESTRLVECMMRFLWSPIDPLITGGYLLSKCLQGKLVPGSPSSETRFYSSRMWPVSCRPCLWL